MLQITLIAFIISITLIFDFLLSLFLGFIEILTPRRQTETVVGAYPIQNSVPFPTIQVNSTSLDLPSPVRKPMTEPGKSTSSFMLLAIPHLTRLSFYP